VTPELAAEDLGQIGYSIAAYPLTLLSASMRAMIEALRALKGRGVQNLMDFDELRERIGFNTYYEISGRYESSRREKN
jgi:2-methylisocitrate lyase-like PEP mutase family enzyme